MPDLSLFPPSAAVDGEDLRVGGCLLGEIADRFGTPAYVVDERALRGRPGAARGPARDLRRPVRARGGRAGPGRRALIVQVRRAPPFTQMSCGSSRGSRPDGEDSHREALS
jgi:hypothetical protein